MTAPAGGPVPAWVVSAVALIDRRRRVLLQKRAAGAEHGGLWEFPGGKLEPGETAAAAAVRELAEELAVLIAPESLVPLSFASGLQRSGRPIVLLLYACRRWQGEPICRHAQAIAWFAADALESLEMPPLDVPLIAAVRAALEACQGATPPL